MGSKGYSSKTALLPAGTISTPAAAAITKLNSYTLRRWVWRGVLTPVVFHGEPGTKGAAYGWRLSDVLAARTIREMRAAGLSAQKVRAAARTVSAWGETFASVKLWSDGRDAWRVLPSDRLVSVVQRPGQHRLFPLGTWADETSKRFVRELERLAKRERAA